MVVEHLHDPASDFREIRRILRPQGLFIFHTLNRHGYDTSLARLIPERPKRKLTYILEGRGGNDVFETHYKANTSGTITALAQGAGFELVKLRLLGTHAVSTALPPLFTPELLWVRMLTTKRLRLLRPNIITTLKKV